MDAQDARVGHDSVETLDDDLTEIFRMTFLGGFVGVTQDRETRAVTPQLGWAVREG